LVLFLAVVLFFVVATTLGLDVSLLSVADFLLVAAAVPLDVNDENIIYIICV